MALRLIASRRRLAVVCGQVLREDRAPGKVLGLGDNPRRHAVEDDPPLRADELHVSTRMVHLDTVGVVEDRVAVQADFHGAAMVHAQRPLADVEMVAAPVGHAAAVVVAVGTPLHACQAAMVRPPGGGAKARGPSRCPPAGAPPAGRTGLAGRRNRR